MTVWLFIECGYIVITLWLQFLQELGQKNEWVSELIFGSLFGSFMLWSFSPFVTAQKRFYTAVLFSRLLMVLVSKYSTCYSVSSPPCTLCQLRHVYP